jgi:hypothetical protein
VSQLIKPLFPDSILRHVSLLDLHYRHGLQVAESSDLLLRRQCRSVPLPVRQLLQASLQQTNECHQWRREDGQNSVI